MCKHIQNTIVAIAVAIFLAGPAWATPYNKPGPRANTRYELTVSTAAFTGLDIHSAKTFDAINIGGYHTVLVEIQYTYHSATAINMTCEESPDNLKWFLVPQADESAPPTVSHAQRIWTWALSAASVNVFFEVPALYRYLKCSIYTTGGDASDTATVTATVAE